MDTMEKLLFYFVVFTVTYKGVIALRCFSCHGSSTSDCAKNSSNAASIQECGWDQKKLPEKDNWGFVPSPSDYLSNSDTNLMDEGLDEDEREVSRVCLYIRVKTNHKYSDAVMRHCHTDYNGDDYCAYLNRHKHDCHSCSYDLCN